MWTKRGKNYSRPENEFCFAFRQSRFFKQILGVLAVSEEQFLNRTGHKNIALAGGI